MAADPSKDEAEEVNEIVLHAIEAKQKGPTEDMGRMEHKLKADADERKIQRDAEEEVDIDAEDEVDIENNLTEINVCT